ncbi:MAG: XrtA system polysaccharide deacetylase [Planctomycetota bacterium]
MSFTQHMTQQPLTNAMTVDVEDYFHVSGFADRISPREWSDFPSRVVASTQRILRVLDAHQTAATFFVLGWVAERFPQLVRDIRKAGHEIGCHSHWHRLVYDLSPDEFRDDLRTSRDVLQDIIGEPVQLYRAPSFSITRQSLWALEILADEGFTGDSSIYPVYHDRYGIPDADPVPHRIATSAGMVDEFPGTALQLSALRLPISGGGYFRLYPFRFSRFCLNRYSRQSNRPFVFYIHPWEVDPDQPRLPGRLLSRFRHYQNLHTTEHKLNALLPQFRFSTMTDSLASIAGSLREHSLAAGLYTSKARQPESLVSDLQPQGA